MISEASWIQIVFRVDIFQALFILKTAAAAALLLSLLHQIFYCLSYKGPDCVCRVSYHIINQLTYIYICVVCVFLQRSIDDESLLNGQYRMSDEEGVIAITVSSSSCYPENE